MSQGLVQLQNEAISLESNIGKLYLLFHDLFAEDAPFRGQLAIEENGHAELIRSGVDLFNEAGDRDHADRIVAYMHDLGIEQQP